MKMINEYINKKYKYILWLDDLRCPMDHKWKNVIKNAIGELVLQVNWCHTYDDFVNQINEYGLPEWIFFDNDLGEEKEGYDCAKWLVDYCLDNNVKCPNYYIQSDNGPAQDNISKLIDNFKKFQNESSNCK